MTRCLTLPSLEDGLAVSEEEQWFTTSQLGSPSFSSPASATSMPSLEQPTASIEEGYIYASTSESPFVREEPPHIPEGYNFNQAEWSSYEEEQSTPSASMAYRGEIFALNAAANV